MRGGIHSVVENEKTKVQECPTKKFRANLESEPTLEMRAEQVAEKDLTLFSRSRITVLRREQGWPGDQSRSLLVAHSTPVARPLRSG